jgi:Tfp pilus assembly protein PilF
MSESMPPSPSLALAYRAFEQGDVAAVLDMAERVERAEGHALPWKTLKAVALSMLHKPLLALPEYRWLCEMQPQNAAHWSNLGNCLCEL